MTNPCDSSMSGLAGESISGLTTGFATSRSSMSGLAGELMLGLTTGFVTSRLSPGGELEETAGESPSCDGESEGTTE